MSHAKLGLFLCSLDNLVQKNVIVFFLKIKFQDGAHLKKGLFRLLSLHDSALALASLYYTLNHITCNSLGMHVLPMVGNILLDKIVNESEDVVSKYTDALGNDTLAKLFIKVEADEKRGSSRPRMKLPWNKGKAGKSTERSDINTTKSNLLPEAVDRGYNKTALVLLDSGCDPYVEGNKVGQET